MLNGGELLEQASARAVLALLRVKIVVKVSQRFRLPTACVLVACAAFVIWSVAVDHGDELAPGPLTPLTTAQQSAQSAIGDDNRSADQPMGSSVPIGGCETADSADARSSELLSLSAAQRRELIAGLAAHAQPAEAYEMLLMFYQVDPEAAFFDYQDVLVALFGRDWEFLTTIAIDDIPESPVESQRLLSLAVLRASISQQKSLEDWQTKALEQVFFAAEDPNLRAELALNFAAHPGLAQPSQRMLEDFVFECDTLPYSQLGHVLPAFIERLGASTDESLPLYRSLALKAKSEVEISGLFELLKSCKASAGIRVLCRHLPASERDLAESMLKQADEIDRSD